MHRLWVVAAVHTPAGVGTMWTSCRSQRFRRTLNKAFDVSKPNGFPSFNILYVLRLATRKPATGTLVA
jgi:hypothetical protein